MLSHCLFYNLVMNLTLQAISIQLAHCIPCWDVVSDLTSPHPQAENEPCLLWVFDRLMVGKTREWTAFCEVRARAHALNVTWMLKEDVQLHGVTSD